MRGKSWKLCRKMGNVTEKFKVFKGENCRLQRAYGLTIVKGVASLLSATYLWQILV